MAVDPVLKIALGKSRLFCCATGQHGKAQPLSTAKMINIGQNIKEELCRQERTVSWLARKLGCNRASVYRLMSKNSIDTAMLWRISLLLRRDFFGEISAELYRHTNAE